MYLYNPMDCCVRPNFIYFSAHFINFSIFCCTRFYTAVCGLLNYVAAGGSCCETHKIPNMLHDYSLVIENIV